MKLLFLREMKLKAKIQGSKVHDVGYRVFLLDKALELGMERFAAYNRTEDGSQMVLSLAEGDEDQIAQFREFVQENRPIEAEVSEMTFEEYDGRITPIMDFLHMTQIQQLNKGIPALLRIEQIQVTMLEKQCQMLGKQDQMLGKQDVSIGILQDIKEDTSHIGAIKEDVLAIREENTHMKEDLISDIKSGRLEEKYEQLSQEIAEIKTALAEIKAKVS